MGISALYLEIHSLLLAKEPTLDEGRMLFLASLVAALRPEALKTLPQLEDLLPEGTDHTLFEEPFVVLMKKFNKDNFIAGSIGTGYKPTRAGATFFRKLAECISS